MANEYGLPERAPYLLQRSLALVYGSVAVWALNIPISEFDKLHQHSLHWHWECDHRLSYLHGHLQDCHQECC